MCLRYLFSSAFGDRRPSADAHWDEVDSFAPCRFDVEAQRYLVSFFFDFSMNPVAIHRFGVSCRSSPLVFSSVLFLQLHLFIFLWVMCLFLAYLRILIFLMFS